MMRRVLLLATTTGYQTRAFGEAAERLGVDLVFATDRCNVLEDPWQDAALRDPVPPRARVDRGDRRARAVAKPIDGVLAVGDRPSIIAAATCEALGLPWHPVGGGHDRAQQAADARTAARTPACPCPGSARSISPPTRARCCRSTFPCVVKPVALSGSRGVMRADDEPSLVAAFNRLRSLMKAPDIRGERSEIHETALVEGFIEGREFAVEGLMTAGRLRTLAIFDKPDPLDGPFFEETIYVTPSSEPSERQAAIVDAVTAAAEALGLRHGPIHAECRVNATRRVRARSAAAADRRPVRPRVAVRRDAPDGVRVSFEELCCGTPSARTSRD